MLEQSQIDIAIVGRFFRPSLRLRVQELDCDRNVCIMRRGHPLSRKKLTLKQYVNAKHLLVSLTGEPTGFVEPNLQTLKTAIAINERPNQADREIARLKNRQTLEFWQE